MKLCVPERILESHAMWLGKTGAGKSSAMRHIVEWLLSKDGRVCIIDPKGEWHGLKSSADGRSPGFKVIALGDFKEPKAQDVPINEMSGKPVAELVASGNRPCIIGMRGWTITAMSRFWIDFASALFNCNTAGGIKLFIDEIQNFAPKERTGFGSENMGLHWTKRLLSEGRGIGLAVMAGSQRPASVHNGVLTQCETLVAMRVIHKSDRKAVTEWIEGCADPDSGREMVDGLAQLQRREAFVWSPECGFGPVRLTFPMFSTFDSFAPPQAQKRITAGGWAGVDLDEVKAKLASVIEEQKAKDPQELQKELRHKNAQIAKLEREIVAFHNNAVKQVEQVSVPVLGEIDKKIITDIELSIREMFGQSTKTWEFIGKEVSRLREQLITVIQKFPASVQTARSQIPLAPRHRQGDSPSLPRAVPVRTAVPTNSNGSLAKAERLILTAALQHHPNPSTKTQLAIRSVYSVTSGGFNNALGKLRSLGLLIGGGDRITVTETGIGMMPDYRPLPISEELLKQWLDKLPKAESTILNVISNYPGGVDKEDVARGSGYSSTSGGFNNALGRLRTLELINRGWPAKINAELT